MLNDILTFVAAISVPILGYIGVRHSNQHKEADKVAKIKAEQHKLIVSLIMANTRLMSQMVEDYDKPLDGVDDWWEAQQNLQQYLVEKLSLDM